MQTNISLPNALKFSLRTIRGPSAAHPPTIRRPSAAHLRTIHRWDAPLIRGWSVALLFASPMFSLGYTLGAAAASSAHTPRSDNPQEWIVGGSSADGQRAVGGSSADEQRTVRGSSTD
ncbi:hypothetical protein B0H17DRAFT_1195167 [Mycena rosella]|uniref:Uncharacterized protein n=1 Tax=Mycena rosella TaxID=1033263 RepID=A0AAD7DZP1_MYCRO|nr:hypothetical protein B0H17DRAFT_1195167 [Mycena rosella]